MKNYDELSEDLKRVAKKMNPNDYKDWFYKVNGVVIVFCSK